MHTLEITKTHDLFPRLSWVGRAIYRGNEANKDVMRRIVVEPARIMATDGNRVHISRGDHTMIPGQYHLDTFGKSKITVRLDEGEPLDYPNTNVIWPEAGRDATTFTVRINYIHENTHVHTILARVIRLLPRQWTVDYKLLVDMLEGQDLNIVSVPLVPAMGELSAPKVATLFTRADLSQTGLLMPMRVD